MDGTPGETIRIFLSSSFKEFGAERDLLVRRVFPKLRAGLRERGLDLVEVDLRWGITEEQSRRGETIAICLAEIERSSYFIGLIGDVYTRFNGAFDERLSSAYPWLVSLQGVSITEMEMQHAALGNEARKRAASFFYARSPTRARTVEEEADIARLTRAIEASGAPFAGKIESAEALIDRLERELTQRIDRDYPPAASSDPYARAERLNQAFARVQAHRLSGREEAFAALEAQTNAVGGQEPLLLTGENGAGKSALLGAWSHARAQRDGFVFGHFVGVSPEDDTPAAIAARLRARLPAAPVTPTPGDADDFAALLDGAASRAGRHGPAIIVFDGLDQLRDGKDLLWLPSLLPNNLVVVASSVGGSRGFSETAFWNLLGGLTHFEAAALGEEEDHYFSDAISDDPVADAWLRRRWKTLELNALAEPARAHMIEREAARFSKSLSPAQVSRLSQHLLAGNALFVRTVLDELRLAARFQDFEAVLEYYLASTSLADLFERVLARLERDCSTEAVANICRLMQVSRAGLEESELMALSGASPIQWSTFAVETDGLVRQGARVRFDNEALRAAAARRYVTSQPLERAVRRTIAERFKHDAPPRAAEETPWQLAHGQFWDELEGFLTDGARLPALLERDFGELLKYWIELQQRGRDPGALLTRAFEQCYPRLDSSAALELGGRLARFLRFSGALSQPVLHLHQNLARASERTWGPRHPGALAHLQALGEFEMAAGRAAEAEKSFHFVLSHLRPVATKDAQRSAAEISYARVLMSRREFARAEPLLRAAAQAQTTNVAAAVAAKRGLAACLAARGGEVEAATLRFEALATCVERYGREHPETLECLDGAIESHVYAGDLVRAMYDCRALLEARERLFGLDHPLTLSAGAALAGALRRVDDRSSQPLLSYTVERMQKVLGDNHPVSLDALDKIAGRLLLLNEGDRGLKIYQRVLEGRRQSLGDDHPDTLAALSRVAYANYCNGDFVTALAKQNELIAKVSRAFGKGAWREEAVRFLETIKQVKRRPEQLDRYLRRNLEYGPAIGIGFDIDGLGGGQYGRAAFQLLFDALDPMLLVDTRWRDGDTRATLQGGDRVYVISIETAHTEHIPAIRAAIASLKHPGLLAGAGRFLARSQLEREPLVVAMRIGPHGAPDWVGGSGFWLDAWLEAKERRKQLHAR